MADPFNEVSKVVDDIVSEPQQRSLTDLSSGSTTNTNPTLLENQPGVESYSYLPNTYASEPVTLSSLEEKKNRLFGGRTPEDTQHELEMIEKIQGPSALETGVNAARLAGNVATEVVTGIPEFMVEQSVKGARNIYDLGQAAFGDKLNERNYQRQLTELRDTGEITQKGYELEMKNSLDRQDQEQNKLNETIESKDSSFFDKLSATAQRDINDPDGISKRAGLDDLKEGFKEITTIDQGKFTDDNIAAMNESGKLFANAFKKITGHGEDAEDVDFDKIYEGVNSFEDLTSMVASVAASLMAAKKLNYKNLAASDIQDSMNSSLESAEINGVKLNQAQKDEAYRAIMASGSLDALVDKALVGGGKLSTNASKALEKTEAGRSLSQLAGKGKKKVKDELRFKEGPFEGKIKKSIDNKKAKDEANLNDDNYEPTFLKTAGGLAKEAGLKTALLGSKSLKVAGNVTAKQAAKGVSKGIKFGAIATAEAAQEAVQESIGTYQTLKSKYENETGTKDASFNDVVNSMTPQQKHDFYISAGAGALMGGGSKLVNPVLSPWIKNKNISSKEKMEMRDKSIDESIASHNEEINFHNKEIQRLESIDNRTRLQDRKLTKYKNKVSKFEKTISKLEESKHKDINNFENAEEEFSNRNKEFNNYKKEATDKHAEDMYKIGKEEQSILKDKGNNTFEDAKNDALNEMSDEISQEQETISKLEGYVSDQKELYEKGTITKDEYQTSQAQASGSIKQIRADLDKKINAKAKENHATYKEEFKRSKEEKLNDIKEQRSKKIKEYNKGIKSFHKKLFGETGKNIKQKRFSEKAYSHETNKMAALGISGSVDNRSTIDKITDMFLTPGQIVEKYDSRINEDSKKHKISNYNPAFLNKNSPEVKQAEEVNSVPSETRTTSADANPDTDTDTTPSNVNSYKQKYKNDKKALVALDEVDNFIDGISKVESEKEAEEYAIKQAQVIQNAVQNSGIKENIDELMQEALRVRGFDVVDEKVNAEISDEEIDNHIDKSESVSNGEPALGSDKDTSTDLLGGVDQAEQVKKGQTKDEVSSNIGKRKIRLELMLEKIQKAIDDKNKDEIESLVSNIKFKDEYFAIEKLIKRQEEQLEWMNEHPDGFYEITYSNGDSYAKSSNAVKDNISRELDVAQDALKTIDQLLDLSKNHMPSFSFDENSKLPISNNKIVEISRDEFNQKRKKQRTETIEKIKDERYVQAVGVSPKFTKINILEKLQKIKSRTKSNTKKRGKKERDTYTKSAEKLFNWINNSREKNLLKVLIKFNNKASDMDKSVVHDLLQEYDKATRDKFYAAVSLNLFKTGFHTELFGLNYGEIEGLIRDGAKSTTTKEEKESFKKEIGYFDVEEENITDFIKNEIDKLKDESELTDDKKEKFELLKKAKDLEFLQNNSNKSEKTKKKKDFLQENVNSDDFDNIDNINVFLNSLESKLIVDAWIEESSLLKDDNEKNKAFEEFKKKHKDTIFDEVAIAHIEYYLNKNKKVPRVNDDLIKNAYEIVNGKEPSGGDKYAKRKYKNDKDEFSENVKNKLSIINKDKKDNKYTMDDLITAEEELFTAINNHSGLNRDSNAMMVANSKNSVAKSMAKLSSIKYNFDGKNENANSKLPKKVDKDIKLYLDSQDLLSAKDRKDLFTTLDPSLEDMNNELNKSIDELNKYKNDKGAIYFKDTSLGKNVPDILKTRPAEEQNKILELAYKIAKLKNSIKAKKINSRKEVLDSKNQDPELSGSVQLFNKNKNDFMDLSEDEIKSHINNNSGLKVNFAGIHKGFKDFLESKLSSDLLHSIKPFLKRFQHISKFQPESKNGEFYKTAPIMGLNINDKKIAYAAYASIVYEMTSSLDSLKGSDNVEAIKAIHSIKEGSNLSNSDILKLGRLSGVPSNKFAFAIGMTMASMLGIKKPNNNTSTAEYMTLLSQLGNMAILTMQKEGILEENSLNVEEYSKLLGKTKAEQEEILSNYSKQDGQRLQKVKFYRFKKGSEEKVNALELLSKKKNDEGKKELYLVVNSPKNANPFSEAQKVEKDEDGNVVPVGAVLPLPEDSPHMKKLEEEHKTPFYLTPFADSFMDKYGNVNYDLVEQMKIASGWKDSSKIINSGLREIQEAKNKSIEKEIDDAIDYINVMRTDEKDKSYFKYKIYTNMRMMIDSIFSPQRSKIHRQLMVKDGQSAKITDSNLFGYKRAVVQALYEEGTTDENEFDVNDAKNHKIDKSFKDTINNGFNEVVNKYGDIAKKLAGGSKLNDSEMELFNEAVDVEDMASLHALHDLGRYLQNKKNHTSHIAFETDAKNSGFAHQLFQYPVSDDGNFGEKHRAMMNRIGAFFGNDSQEVSLDAYEHLATYMFSSSSDLANGLKLLLGVDNTDTISSSMRKMAKTPLMTYLYGAGLNTIKGGLSKAIESKVLSEIENILQSNTGRRSKLRDLNKALSALGIREIKNSELIDYKGFNQISMKRIERKMDFLDDYFNENFGEITKIKTLNIYAMQSSFNVAKEKFFQLADLYVKAHNKGLDGKDKISNWNELPKNEKDKLLNDTIAKLSFTFKTKAPNGEDEANIQAFKSKTTTIFGNKAETKTGIKTSVTRSVGKSFEPLYSGGDVYYTHATEAIIQAINVKGLNIFDASIDGPNTVTDIADKLNHGMYEQSYLKNQAFDTFLSFHESFVKSINENMANSWIRESNNFGKNKKLKELGVNNIFDMYSELRKNALKTLEAKLEMFKNDITVFNFEGESGYKPENNEAAIAHIKSKIDLLNDKNILYVLDSLESVFSNKDDKKLGSSKIESDLNNLLKDNNSNIDFSKIKNLFNNKNENSNNEETMGSDKENEGQKKKSRISRVLPI